MPTTDEAPAYLTRCGLPDPAAVTLDVWGDAVWEHWLEDGDGRIGVLRAVAAAEYLRLLLDPACDRTEVVGSVRRGRVRVKDVELVVRPLPAADLFNGLATPTLDYVISAAIAHGRVRLAGGDGERMKKLEILSEVFHPRVGEPREYDMAWIKCDLFIVRPPAQFGLVQLLRTGPAEYSQWVVTSKAQGGALPGHLAIYGAALWYTRDGKCELVPTETEADVCAALGIDLVDPELRAPQWRR